LKLCLFTFDFVSGTIMPSIISKYFFFLRVISKRKFFTEL
jgi:hypothetical protein